MRVRDRGVIFQADQAPLDCRACAFSSLVQLANGTLVAAFRVASGRDSSDGRLRIVRTSNEGKTWETLHEGMTATVNGTLGNLYSGYLTELAPGRLVGSFLWVDRSNPELSFVNTQTAGILPTRLLVSESLDGGANWLPFREVESTPHAGCAGTGPIMALSDKTLALPYESWKEYDDVGPGDHGAHLRISHDSGETWPDFRTVAVDPQGRYLFWDQRSAAHPETGQQVAMFWTHDRTIGSDLSIHVAWGSPDGSEWSVPTPTGLPGQHCQPVAVGGDQLAAVYVHRVNPPSLRVALSQDFGHTWDRTNELTFYNSPVGPEAGIQGDRAIEDYWQDMMAWRFGHPRAVQLSDSDLFVVFYAGDTAATSMHWVRISL